MRIAEPEPVGPCTTEDLKQSRIFGGIDDATLADFVPHCRLCTLAQDKKLLTSRGGERFLYSIQKGYISLRIEAPSLAWDNFVSWRGPGAIIGETAVFFDKSDTATIRTTDPLELLEIPVAELIQLANKTPYIYRNLGCLIMEKLKMERVRAEIIQTPPGPRRMATLITRLIQDRQYEPNSRVIPGRFTYKDVAGYLGIRWETASQNINYLVKERVIEWKDRRIKVLDEDKLKAFMTK